MDAGCVWVLDCTTVMFAARTRAFLSWIKTKQADEVMEGRGIAERVGWSRGVVINQRERGERERMRVRRGGEWGGSSCETAWLSSHTCLMVVYCAENMSNNKRRYMISQASDKQEGQEKKVCMGCWAGWWLDGKLRPHCSSNHPKDSKKAQRERIRGEEE